MCGRYTITSDIDELEQEFEAEAIGLEGWRPIYNAAPMMNLPVLLQSEKGNRILYPLRWGFIPPWGSPDSEFKMINARKERLTESKAWRPAFLHHRCIVPADGFFEWESITDGPNQPYYIHLTDDDDKQHFGFAGLYSKWQSPDGEVIPTYSIITVNANDKVGQLHDRMPAVLHPDEYGDWLQRDASETNVLLDMLKPIANEEIDYYPVSTDLNRTQPDYINEPYLIEPAESD